MLPPLLFYIGLSTGQQGALKVVPQRAKPSSSKSCSQLPFQENFVNQLILSQSTVDILTCLHGNPVDEEVNQRWMEYIRTHIERVRKEVKQEFIASMKDEARN